MLGIFDSGSGGLTVLKEIRVLMPDIDVVYFGDIGNVPYGEKTQAELSQLTAAAIAFLVDHNVTNIVSACNSVSATVVLSMLEVLGVSSISFLEMVGPTVSNFKKRNAERIILVATPATINSNVYQNSFRLIGKDIQTIALPGLAGAIERGESDEKIQELLAHAFNQPVDADVCILGCTHYPFVVDMFENVLPGVKLYNPAAIVASRVQERFQELGTGITKFYISKDSAVFRNRVRELFGEDVAVAVV